MAERRTESDAGEARRDGSRQDDVAPAPDEAWEPADGEPRSEGEGRPEGEARSEGDQVADDLEELLDQARAERDEYLDLAQRTRADFDNYRKRVAADAREAELRGTVRAAESLLPVLDAFERALEAEAIDPEAEDHEGLAAGLVLLHRELTTALRRLGVESTDPTGERFDPHRHEAVTSVEDSGAGSGEIVETVERGYTLDDRVVRAPRVVVAK